jgi:hypothetical protein
VGAVGGTFTVTVMLFEVTAAQGGEVISQVTTALLTGLLYIYVEELLPTFAPFTFHW